MVIFYAVFEIQQEFVQGVLNLIVNTLQSWIVKETSLVSTIVVAIKEKVYFQYISCKLGI
jgi:hypothetical protein